MIISVRVPADAFFQAANVLKINDYYILPAVPEEMFSEIDDIRRLIMATDSSPAIIRVMNEEDESKWFLSQCKRAQINVMTHLYDILLIGIMEVTNQATLDLLNMTPYNRHGDAWLDMVEERAREAFRTHSTDVWIHLVDSIHGSLVDAGIDVGRVWYNDPVYQSFLSSLHSQPLDSIGFVPSDYATRRNGAPIIKVEDEPRFEESKDTKPQMSISELLFGSE